jgi:signal transduction histidine kinase
MENFFGINFYIISHLLTGSTAIALGLIVARRKKKLEEVEKTFTILAGSVAIWSFSYSIWLLSTNHDSALFWSRALNMGATMIPVLYFHWIVSLLKLNKKYRKILIFYYTITCIFLIFSFSDFYIKNTKRIGQFLYWPQANWMYFLFLVLGWCTMISHGFMLLFRELKLSIGFKREQIKFVIWGSAIGFIGGATNFPSMAGYGFIPPVGSPLVVAYPIVFAYTIVKHRLMDISLVLRRSYVFISSFATIFLLVAGTRYLIELYFPNPSAWSDALPLLAAMLIYPNLQSYYFRIANTYFFSSLYDSKKVIADLSEKLSRTIEIGTICNNITDTFASAFHATAIGILVYNPKIKKYEVRQNKGFNVPVSKIFSRDSHFYSHFIYKGSPIIIEELARSGEEKNSESLKALTEYGAEVVVPMNIEDKTIGLIVLGKKESKDVYNQEDLQVLKIVGMQAAIAIENALLYEETKAFNIKLTEEVERATKELKKANRELVKLDEAKSDFISIASHQLRTPLTVIKGYVSMLLEGSFGKLTIEEENSLRKVFESNERLIRLVENLLNISRIESGRMTYRYEDGIRLEEIVISVCGELAQTADLKKIKLDYSGIVPNLPTIRADSEKIRQVVLNLVDNSIKYTKAGSVSVAIKKEGESLVCSVKDTGIGFTEEDKRRLFKRFSRGKATTLLYTEGTGLGLYVGKMVVNEHHGKIWAESEGPGKGSSFYFSLPIK